MSYIKVHQHTERTKVIPCPSTPEEVEGVEEVEAVEAVEGVEAEAAALNAAEFHLKPTRVATRAPQKPPR